MMFSKTCRNTPTEVRTELGTVVNLASDESWAGVGYASYIVPPDQAIEIQGVYVTRKPCHYCGSRILENLDSCPNCGASDWKKVFRTT